MLGYDFEIIYKKEKKNVVADALSRYDEDIEGLLCAISIPQFNWVEEVRIEWKQDQKACKIIQKLQEDPNALDKFVWNNDLFLQSDRQIEIVNKYLDWYLCHFAYDKKTQWVKWLPLGEWWYKKTFHTS